MVVGGASGRKLSAPPHDAGPHLRLAFAASQKLDVDQAFLRACESLSIDMPRSAVEVAM